MATHSPARVTFMFVGLLTVVVATVFNTLREFGSESGEAACSCLFVCCFTLVALLSSSSDPLCCPSGCRRLSEEGGRSDAKVPDAYHAGTLDLLRVGLRLFLDFGHVHVLPGWTLQKVCP